MKAILLPHAGPTTVLTFGDVPDPEPIANQVLIELRAAALNHVDIWVRSGDPAYPVSFPHIMGSDGSGVIRKLGPEAEGVNEGDRVLIIPALTCGRCEFCLKGADNQCDSFEILGTKRAGTYGELVAVPDDNVLPIPDGFSFESAAAFPLAYLTAWHMLMGRSLMKKKETLLVVGGGSGIGAAAIQIGKWRGARVLALTTHATKEKKLKLLGADEVLVIKEGANFSDWIQKMTGGKGADVVFEHVGPATWESSVRSLSKQGRLVTCGATTGPVVQNELRTLFSRDLSILGSKMGTKKEFQELAALLLSGEIKPIVDKVFPLEAAAEAHRYMEEGHQVGKIVLKHPTGATK